MKNALPLTLLLFSFSVFLVGCQTDETDFSSVEQDNVEDEVEATTEWSTYRNEEYGFSFNYQNSLTIDDYNRYLTSFYGTDETYNILWLKQKENVSNAPLINISISSLDLDTLTMQYKEYDAEFGTNLSEGVTEVQNLNGYYIEKRDTAGSVRKTFFFESSDTTTIISIPNIQEYDSDLIINSYSLL